MGPPTIGDVEWKFRRTRDDGTPEPRHEASAMNGGSISLSRAALDALQVGVLVLDPSDRPALINAAAREMGLVRSRSVAGKPTEEAHTIVRTLAGQVRRSGITRV